jgi:hypothetical protein
LFCLRVEIIVFFWPAARPNLGSAFVASRKSPLGK